MIDKHVAQFTFWRKVLTGNNSVSRPVVCGELVQLQKQAVMKQLAVEQLSVLLNK